MYAKKKIALIPSYEPDERLVKLVQDVTAAGFAAVVVDDGSGEDYREIFDSASGYAHVISYPDNRGKGAALKTGYSYIAASFTDSTVVTMDSDGQHTVPDAMNISRAAEARPGSLILGSRALAENVPLRSRFGNSVTRGVYRLSTGLAVHDTQTGLRAFHTSMLPLMMKIPGDRYEYEMNVLLELAKLDIPIREVPIETIYIDNNSGSHFDTVKDSARIYKEILKFSASSLLGFGVDYALYSLITALFGIPAAANIIARIVSSTVNFTVNRKLVFESDKPLGRAALQYFTLAAGILAGNTLVLKALTMAGMNAYIAKLLV
ncbi:MAG: bifunctional glycosyltransferase family 2/GtrA family protein, partial [Ruminococcus sp.]|nr:bifunctional glycosyltransferase family 2/GtrA family protein [Ruminococcus sp.]